ncbi:MAG: UDP-N-acetylmuramate--L-alanine ligase [Armatimonadetes bacterium]|nr:UDP-N-acetylmuramate--L-alanine ligase [Armatimonadota bacterium]
MRTKREIETEFAPRATLHASKSFFLVGIGGAGMSGIARMLRHRGFNVKGTDSTPSPLIEELRAEGTEVWIGHSGDFVSMGDAIVLTDAIDLKASPEVRAAKELDCPLYRRSQVLGWLLEGKKTIAVTGTHGKTTTTGMIGAGLRAAGLDPTIVVGAEVPEFGGAIVEGTSEWAVIEACEAYDSLRDFDPYIAVLTNLELDHVDFHGSWEGLKKTLLDFACRVPEDGAFVWCSDDDGAYEFRSEDFDGACPNGRETLAYGFRDRMNELTDEERRSGGLAFRLLEKFIRRAQGLQPSPDWTGALRMAGRHNALNALGALTACEHAGADREAAIQGIQSYAGAERRLQVLHEGDVTVIDDYAHHPTEIVASLQAVRERYVKSGRLVIVYQPHLYSRTEPLIPEFAHALDGADLVVLTDIYPAREAPIAGVSSFRIAELVEKPCVYVPQRHLLPRKVAGLVRAGDVVVGMGAGNISEFAPAFIEEVKRGTPFDRAAKVAVLFGGDSAEREVSILSGRAVQAALEARGYDAWLFDASEALLSKGDLSGLLDRRPDVCFLTVHGTNAEDGAVQGLLELLHLPYTGSGVQASAVAMDKRLTKTVYEAEGLPCPRGVLLRVGDALAWPESRTGWVVKPNAQGSTVGLSFVDDERGLEAAVIKARRFGDDVLVEEWLRGVEISVPVLGDTALPVVEIVPASGAYDFESKYTPGATTEICPARLSPEQTAEAQRFAVRAHRALGCEGCSRTDMIVTGDRTVCLETNTLPGMTATSLVPNSAQAAGTDFGALCAWMVEDALARAAKKGA